jgi:hypothetical protein
MANDGGSLSANKGINTSSLILTTKAGTSNAFTITNLGSIPEMNRLPDYYSILVYRDASKTPIFYDVTAGVAAASTLGIYSVVFALNNSPITLGYVSTANSGSIYCSAISSGSIPLTANDITKAAADSVTQQVKLLLYYYNS